MRAAERDWQEVPFHRPISTNKLFANVRGKGRVRSSDYNAWRRVAKTGIMAIRPKRKRVCGPIKIEIRVPRSYRGDLDNCAKAPIDSIVEMGLIDDDKCVEEVRLLRYDGDCMLLRYCAAVVAEARGRVAA